MADLQKGLFQKENSGSYRMELSKEEEEAMERWGLNDQKMDAKLDLIIEGLDQLKYKAVNIGEVNLKGKVENRSDRWIDQEVDD